MLKILECVDPAYKPYTAVRFYTGIKSGEIDGLKWSDYKDKLFSTPKISINKTLVYGIEGETKTKKSNRIIDCLIPVVEAIDEQRKINGGNEYIFCKDDGALMNPDHFREVIWKKALNSAEIEYRPPIQTRHTFATMMITAGEDVGWVQKMLGHSSLQMIFNHYYSWIPQKTRSDGTAFMNNIQKNKDDEKIINIFGKMAQ
ncbi:MAG: site-specific integrase [Desulfobacula sp.]|nr:site-specific integrase [Desulfobacula sp.]MCD4720468.1 site-specific integrase [Desulfobacula sp.]